MAYETLIVEQRGQVDWVTLNRPEVMNALDNTLVDELGDYFESLYWNRDTRVVVLRGAGKAFCAGLDLKAPTRNDRPRVSRGPAEGLDSQRRIAEIVIKMRRCPQPIISLVHGPACGGGFALALASDIRIAGESARMNCAFIRIGLGGCDIGSSYFLPRLVGVSVASELILTGRFIHAPRALAVGLVSEVVPDAELEAAAQPYVDAMITTAPLGLRLSKECLNMSVDAGSLQQVIAMEDRNQILCAQTEDMREGMAAFLEKRPPQYRNA
jgi:enoyl-CoA hydratase